jgi:hypothetical protein
VTYDFDVVEYGLGSHFQPTPIADLPDLGDMSVSFDDSSYSVTDDVAGIKTVKAQSGNFIPDISDFDTLGVGEYIYKIKELPVEDTYGSDDTINAVNSSAEYVVHIYVKDATDSDGNPYLYIAYVVVWKTLEDDGTAPEEGDYKVDPTPGDGTDTFSDMFFTNSYVKTFPTDPYNGGVLFVEETVPSGEGDRDLYFPFSVKVTHHELFTGENPTYKAYVVEDDDDDGIFDSVLDDTRVLVHDADGDPSTTGDNIYNTPDGLDDAYTGDGDDSRGYYVFEDGASRTVWLKHNQRLVFADAHVGAEWVAVERLTAYPDDFADYTASADVTVNLVTITPSLVGEKGQDLTTLERLVGNQNPDNVESATYAIFTNSTEDDILPMGIDINNLPYLGLILLALAAFAAYIALKTRRRRNLTHNA